MLILNYDENGLPIFREDYHSHITKEEAINYIKLLQQYIDKTDLKKLDYEENLYFYNEVYKPNIKRSLALHGKRKVAGHVYFAIREDKLTKIGCSSSLYKRISTLTREHGKLQVYHMIYSENMYVTEFAFHELFSKQRKSGEWFDLLPKDLRYIKNGSYHNFIQTTIDGNDFDYDAYFEEYFSRRAL